MKGSIRRLVLFYIVLIGSVVKSDENVCEPRVPEDCKVVMARSTLNNEKAGWGMFVLDDFARASRVLYGDVVIHLVDLPGHPGLAKALRSYWWSAEETGGFFEGRKVASFVPGVGSLANGIQDSNVLPAFPFYDEGGLTRSESPGAGAITMYHNYSFYASKNLVSGDELLVNYGPNWFRERESELVNATAPTRRDPSQLRQTGYCVDNIQPGRSKLAHAGRGAMASRDMDNNTIVAPVPVLAIPKSALKIQRQRQDDSVFESFQLLLNYCYGSQYSSLVMCPYSPMVNSVNHGAGKYANVKLRWSQRPSGSISDAMNEQLLLELVAIRPIKKGQELLMDYGMDWVNAWVQHMQSWQPGSAMYIPSYVQNDVVKTLRTEEELKDHPYPDNVFTSCYYRYSDNKEAAETGTTDEVTAFRWKLTRGLVEPRNLRPCSILKRHEDDRHYTVQIRNRYGLPKDERTSKVHIVTHVPRQFIRFSDKLYTTDPHLEGAFRHEIGLPDFPSSWMDLKETATVT